MVQKQNPDIMEEKRLDSGNLFLFVYQNPQGPNPPSRPIPGVTLVAVSGARCSVPPSWGLIRSHEHGMTIGWKTPKSRDGPHNGEKEVTYPARNIDQPPHAAGKIEKEGKQ